jgi:hypothetical protein
MNMCTSSVHHFSVVVVVRYSNHLNGFRVVDMDHVMRYNVVVAGGDSSS